MDSGSRDEDARTLLALANAERIRILALIADQELTSAGIAAALDLSPEVVTAHLSVLGKAGLIATSKDRHERRVQLRAERLEEIEAACREHLRAGTGEADGTSAVPPSIRQFFQHERLTTFPSKHSRYLEVLGVLITDFAPDSDYPEAEVNQILGRRNEDFATLRRDLVDLGFMTRANGIYRRMR
jgi:DNA-binding transcriptional ArsR family regulator